MWGRKECIGCSRSQEDVHPRLPLDGTWTASRADTRETVPPYYIIILFHFAQSLKYNWFSVGRGRDDMVIMHKSGENMTKDISSASFFDERLQKSIVFLLKGCIRTRSTWPQSAGDQQGVQYSYVRQLSKQPFYPSMDKSGTVGCPLWYVRSAGSIVLQNGGRNWQMELMQSKFCNYKDIDIVVLLSGIKNINHVGSWTYNMWTTSHWSRRSWWRGRGAKLESRNVYAASAVLLGRKIKRQRRIML